MPEYPRSPFEKTATSITPKVDGDAINATIIGETTPAPGSFTTITTTTQNADALILGGASIEGGDVSIYRDASGNKQISIDADAASNAKALDVYGGVVVQNHLTIGQASLNVTYPFAVYGDVYMSNSVYAPSTIYTDGGISAHSLNKDELPLNIIVHGTDITDHEIKLKIDGNVLLSAKATGNGAGGIDSDSKKIIITGQLQGNLLNNQIVSKATFDILGLMTDPRFLNLQCEDPGAGTMIDVSGQGHNGTYQGSMTTGDRIKNGMGWAIDPDGIDDYIDVGNDNDFSFGDGTNDEPVTWFGIIEVASSSQQMIMSKWNNTTSSELREWRVFLNTSRQIKLTQYDESIDAACDRTENTALSIGWHSYVFTSPGDGGATAMDNVKLYIDGVLAPSSATNHAQYIAMENLAADCWIGANKGTGGDVVNIVNGDIALTGIDGSEWSAYDVHRFHQLCKGLYGI